jgi:hypothetical protein
MLTQSEAESFGVFLGPDESRGCCVSWYIEVMRAGMFRVKPSCFAAIAVLFLLTAGNAAAQADPDRDFSGTWSLEASRSNIADKSVASALSFRAEQSASSLTLIAGSPAGGAATISVYPLDGRSEKYQTGDLMNNTATKWEGAALLVNTIVSGPENLSDFSVAERWSRSHDANTLTITRNVVRASGETESVLVYRNALAASTPPPTQPAMRPAAPPQPALIPRRAPAVPGAGADYVVAAGTHILLRLTNPVNTKTAAPGDRIYLETAVPVFVNGRMVIPVGSYVAGTVTDAKKAGRVKGKSEMTLEYNSITLRSGVSRDLRSRPDSVEGKGNLDKSEGRVQGEGNKAGDAGTVAKTTAAGTGVGAVIGGAAGHLGAGAGIGAAGGALAGLAGVLSSRGPDVVLRAGTTMDMLLDRDLRYSDEELRVRAQ